MYRLLIFSLLICVTQAQDESVTHIRGGITRITHPGRVRYESTDPRVLAKTGIKNVVAIGVSRRGVDSADCAYSFVYKESGEDSLVSGSPDKAKNIFLQLEKLFNVIR